MRRSRAIAFDYDGTLAHTGRVDEATKDALRRVRQSGRRVLMVTGRELDDLYATFDGARLFDLIVAENGALLHDPSTGERRPLAMPPPRAFAQALRERGVAPLSEGAVIVATWEPHQFTVLDVIRQQGLELEIVFNKGAIMVLPAGVSKGSGLQAALKVLDIPAAETIGVGDAENDHSLFSACGFGVAVANAVPALKQRATYVCRGDHGAGVVELVARLERDDEGWSPRIPMR